MRVDAWERLQPVDAREPVPGLASNLGVEEVVGERLRRRLVEPERAQPLERIEGMH
jgi:hypothetical protein